MARTGGYYYGMKQIPYWTQRSKESLRESFETSYEAEKYITELYKKCLLDFSKSYNELLKPYVVDGEIDTGALASARTYNPKFQAEVRRLEKEIQIFSQQLNKAQQKKVLQTLEKVYKDNIIENYKVFGVSSDGIELLNADAVRRAVKTPFTADGREFSDRIWENLDTMSVRLRAKLSESIAKGESIQKTVRKFKDIFGNTTYNTKRIIRTETIATYSKASTDSYKALGVEYVQCLTEANACTECASRANKKIKTKDAKVGITIPPFHPFCKCCVIPLVVWDEE